VRVPDRMATGVPHLRGVCRADRVAQEEGRAPTLVVLTERGSEQNPHSDCYQENLM
jgi:hypothetical protein